MRAVLVTGANSGIGLATVLELARRGYRAIGSVRSPAKARAVREAARAEGLEVRTVILDVTDAAACERVLSKLELYGLVNNAGYGGIGAVEDTADEEARRQLETMVIAPVRLARLALPAMREAGDGRIVMISSIFGRVTSPLVGWYQGAKHALEAVSDALRMEVASSGVKVILVEPGGFRTNIWDDLDEDVRRREDSAFAGAYRRTQQLTKLASPVMGEPSRVAKTIAGAIDAKRPRARYLVGYDAQGAALLDRFPLESVKDRVRRIVLGL